MANKNKHVQAKRTCGECIHEYACSMWSIGMIHNMNAENCCNFETVKDSSAYLIGLLDKDAVPVRHGKWVYHDDDVMPWNSCSLCGCTAFDLHGANYCPNCGARMDEGVSGDGEAQD